MIFARDRASAPQSTGPVGACAAIMAAALAGCASDGVRPAALFAPEPEAAAAPAEPPAPPAPATAPYVVADLIGMTESETEAIFGAPAVRRQEGLGVMRTYAFEGCSLLLFLFEDTEGALTVQHADASARESGAARPDADACLASAPARKTLEEPPEPAGAPETRR